MAIGLLVASLLAVVLAHALLAQQQVRLSAAQAKLTSEQTQHRQDELIVAQLETPSRIVAAAEQQLHMVRVEQITQLPYVSLSTPVPPPHVLPDATPPTAPASTTSSSSTASTSPASSAQTSTSGP